MLQFLGEKRGAGITLCVPSNALLADSLQVAKIEIGSAADKSGKITVGSLMVRRSPMRASACVYMYLRGLHRADAYAR